MAVPLHARCVWRGSFANTEEVWSFHAKFGTAFNNAPDVGYGDIRMDDIGDAFATFLNGPHISVSVVAEDIRVYLIGADGRMSGNGPVMHTFAPGAVKGSGQAYAYPPQVALAISTVATDRGPAKKGRFYLPGPSRNLADDGRLDLANTGDYLTRVTQLLKDTSDCFDAQGLRSVSAVNISPGPAGSSTGTQQNIDHLEVGRVYDTIRTRRNALLEEYVVGGHIDW